MFSNDTRERLAIALSSNDARDEIASILGFHTFGTVYYVDPTNGNNNFDGKSMEAAFETLEHAYSKVTTNKHDVIVLDANSGHALADELAITKNRLHIVGLGFRGGAPIGQRSRITTAAPSTGSAISAIKITGTGVTLNNLKITSSDTLSTSLYCVADGGEFTILRNCWLEKNTDLDQTGAAELLCNGDSSAYIGCTIGNMIYEPSVARQNVLFTRETISGKVARSVTFKDCLFLTFAAATTVALMRTANATDIERFCLVETCKFLSKPSGSTVADAIVIAAALTDGSIHLDRCYIDGNITNIATASSGVFSNLPNSASLGGKATEVT